MSRCWSSRASTPTTAPRTSCRASRCTMGAEPVALIGRNGMGKTTLCKALTGLLGVTGRSTGSVRLAGEDIQGKPPHRIAKAGVGYVPQGRRLFESLTVDEHLQIVGALVEGGVDAEARLRALPAPGRAQARLGHVALGRRAGDALDRPRAAHQPEAAGDGRAVGGPGPDRRGAADRDDQGSRRRRHGPARGRAEPRRRDGARRPRDRDGLGHGRDRDDLGRAARRPRAAEALPRASSRWRTPHDLRGGEPHVVDGGDRARCGAGAAARAPLHVRAVDGRQPRPRPVRRADARAARPRRQRRPPGRAGRLGHQPAR